MMKTHKIQISEYVLLMLFMTKGKCIKMQRNIWRDDSVGKRACYASVRA